MREPGSDDDLGEPGASPKRDDFVFDPPDRPLCPVLPEAYLRWLWRVVPDSKGPAWSSVEFAYHMKMPVAEARACLRDTARYTRRQQYLRRTSRPARRGRR